MMNDQGNNIGNSGRGPLGEKMRLIRFRMKKEQFQFSREIRLIPKRLIHVVVGLLAAAEITGQIILWTIGEPIERDITLEMSSLMLAGIITLIGVFLAALIFLIAYVNRDALRRGMNSTLWTLLVIVLIPAYLFIGFLIYFLLREPLPYDCSECGAEVSARFNYCPNCQHNLRPACPKCNREVQKTDRFCPYCSNDLTMNPDKQLGNDVPSVERA
jgi:RNA polymerase subunit RPABC4/transcription elongation factor Spt4